LSIRHLIQQLAERPSGPAGGLQMPAWLQEFVEQAAEHFEPETPAARAGYICSCTQTGWRVVLFLGMIELVGGADDGAVVPTGFQFDVDAVHALFDRIDRMTWQALPAGCQRNPADADEASLMIDGVLNEQPLQLVVALRPPAEIGPGLLRNLNGHCTPV
jgi:hypothetical protein